MQIVKPLLIRDFLHWQHVKVSSLPWASRDARKQWLSENGSDNRVVCGFTRYWFENEKDAMLFILKWT